MTFKMKQLLLLLLVLSVNLLLQHCNGGSEVWGKAEVSGRVVDANGNAVSGVTVKLYPNDGKLLQESSASVKTTSKNGEYSFEDVPSGSYVVQGIDSLSGSVVEFLRRNIDHDSAKGKTDLKNDTLKHPGKLRVILKNALGNFNGSNGYIPNTPYFYHVVYDTLNIPRIARGKYICEFERVSGFSPVVTDSFQVSPDSQTIISIDVKIDPNGPPPAVKNLIHVGIIDTVLGKAVLKWDTVKVSDLKTYVVYRGINENSLQVLHTTVNTIDTVDLIIDTSGNVVTNYFQVKAKDGGNESPVDTIIRIDAPSPKIVKTQITATLIIPHEKLFIGDTARVVITLKNDRRLIDSVTWTLGKSDSIVETVRFGGKSQCSDTMTFVWNDSLDKKWHITAYDNSGSKDSIVQNVNGSGMYRPDTWLISSVRLPTSRQYLNLVSDGVTLYSIGGCREVVDPRQVGKVIRVGSDMIELFSPDSNAPFKSSKMKTARYYHSSFIYNKKIYSLGGFPQKNNVSSLEMFDPVTQQSTIVATFPYVRFGCTVSIVGEKCYMVGGTIISDTNDININNGVITGSIDAFTIPVAAQGKLSIEHVGDLIVPRSNHAAVVYNGQILVMGGVGTSLFTLSDVEQFELSSGMQIVLGSMKSRRCHFSAVEISGKVFVFGGWVSEGQYLSSVEILDLTSQVEWNNTMRAMNKARYGMSAVAHNGKVYMMGGTVFSNGSTEVDTTISIYYP
jgi:hypothetical protein